MVTATWLKILICIIAGACAGIGTGFAGLSAAVAITPALAIFIGIDDFEAVTISLASDVLASAVSAVVYARKKNVDLKNGWILLVTVIAFTILGVYIAKFIPDGYVSGVSGFGTLFVGLKFFIKPVTTTKEQNGNVPLWRKIAGSIVCGIAVGLICGAIGAGGGVIMLMGLTIVLGFELKTAIGTSVFIMAIVALVSSGTHIVMGSAPDLTCLITCVISTFVFAQISSHIANKIPNKVLNIIVGTIMAVLGITFITLTILQLCGVLVY